MHDLPPDKALLYWIPSGLVAIGMLITLLCSFWKFHKRKLFMRQLQQEYMEVNLAIKRPRIGAIRCNTHGARWEDLMASLSSSNFPNIGPYFRHINQVKTLNPCGMYFNYTKFIYLNSYQLTIYYFSAIKITACLYPTYDFIYHSSLFLLLFEFIVFLYLFTFFGSILEGGVACLFVCLWPKNLQFCTRTDRL